MVSRDTREMDADELAALSEEERQEVQKQVETEFLKKVLDTYEGRHVLFNIIRMGNIHNEDGIMSYDLAQSQRQIGMRDIAVAVHNEILTVRPNAYNLMRKEAEDFQRKFRFDNSGSEEEDYE